MSALLHRPSLLITLAVCLTARACSDPGVPPDPGACEGPPDAGICLEVVASGLQYPLQLEQPPGEDRLMVAEQAGRIRVIEDDQLAETPFLDLHDEVLRDTERGLLGMAFHPGFETNGLLFVTYTDLQGNTRLERFTAEPGADQVDPGTRKLILLVERESGQHSGGLLRFGPDGMLWMATGDALDEWNSQDSTSLHGSLLRLDVDGGDPYAVPADNPYVGIEDARPEIWATGLRNPWRFSFESGGRLFIADVGQSLWEELNIVSDDAAGLDFGWPYMEGSHCFASGCDPDGLVIPALDYGREVGCSIIGGTIYGRDDLPALEGRYVLGDYCGWVGSVAVSGMEAGDLRVLDLDTGVVTSLGTDAQGRLYVMSASTVSRLRPAPEP